MFKKKPPELPEFTEGHLGIVEPDAPDKYKHALDILRLRNEALDALLATEDKVHKLENPALRVDQAVLARIHTLLDPLFFEFKDNFLDDIGQGAKDLQALETIQSLRRQGDISQDGPMFYSLKDREQAVTLRRTVEEVKSRAGADDEAKKALPWAARVYHTLKHRGRSVEDRTVERDLSKLVADANTKKDTRVAERNKARNKIVEWDSAQLRGFKKNVENFDTIISVVLDVYTTVAGKEGAMGPTQSVIADQCRIAIQRWAKDPSNENYQKTEDVYRKFKLKFDIEKQTDKVLNGLEDMEQVMKSDIADVLAKFESLSTLAKLRAEGTPGAVDKDVLQKAKEQMDVLKSAHTRAQDMITQARNLIQDAKADPHTKEQTIAHLASVDPRSLFFGGI